VLDNVAPSAPSVSIRRRRQLHHEQTINLTLAATGATSCRCRTGKAAPAAAPAHYATSLNGWALDSAATVSSSTSRPLPGRGRNTSSCVSGKHHRRQHRAVAQTFSIESGAANSKNNTLKPEPSPTTARPPSVASPPAWQGLAGATPTGSIQRRHLRRHSAPEGPLTLYAQLKDAAGNASNVLTAASCATARPPPEGRGHQQRRRLTSPRRATVTLTLSAVDAYSGVSQMISATTTAADHRWPTPRTTWRGRSAPPTARENGVAKTVYVRFRDPSATCRRPPTRAPSSSTTSRRGHEPHHRGLAATPRSQDTAVQPHRGAEERHADAR